MGSGDNQGLFFIAAGFAVLFLVLVLPRFLRRRSGPGTRPGTFGEPAMDLKAELERLVAEIRDASREELARLDTQMRRLDKLLAECDRKSKELSALLGQAPAAAAPPPPAGEPARPSDPLHDRVYALRDAGRDVAGIGAETGLEKGEVELILGLRRVPAMKPAPKSDPPSDR